MLYTISGQKRGIQIWRSDLKYISLCAACNNESVLCIWTDMYDVRRTVAYFQKSYNEHSKYKKKLSVNKI